MNLLAIIGAGVKLFSLIKHLQKVSTRNKETRTKAAATSNSNQQPTTRTIDVSKMEEFVMMPR
jgi:hypothetical protein